MLKNALFFAIGALVIAFAAPSFFGDPDAHVAARAAVSAPSAQPAQVQSTQMVADAEELLKLEQMPPTIATPAK